MAETIRIEHKPGLKYPWQVRVLNRRDKWVMLKARKTLAEAKRIVARLETAKANKDADSR